MKKIIISLLASGSNWGWAFVGAKGIDLVTTGLSMIQNPNNAFRIFLGRYYFDENMLHGFSQAFTRYSWEAIQTWVGYNATQIRNFAGNVSRVDYLGGATFATKEGNGLPNNLSWGVTIGNNINMSIPRRIEGDFSDYILNNQLYMHKYGHTIQSQFLGVYYLLVIGLPSLISAANSKKIDGDPYGAYTHDYFYSEIWANRLSAWYYSKYYGYFWNEHHFPLNNYH